MSRQAKLPFLRLWLLLGLALILGAQGAAFNSPSQNNQGNRPPHHEWFLLPDPFNSGYTTFLMTIAVGPNGSIYVGGTGGVAMSKNGGYHWTLLNRGLPNLFVTAFGFNSQGELIAAVGNNPFVGVFRYKQGRWLQSSGISASLRVTGFTLDKTGALIAITAWAGDVFRSTDGGSTFTKVAANVGASTPGSSVGALWAVSKGPDDALYTGGEPWGGLYRSTDNGSTWQNFGLSYAQGYEGNIMAIGYNAANELLVSRPSNGYAVDMQHYMGNQWEGCSDGLPPYHQVTSIVRNANGEVFASLAHEMHPNPIGGVYRSLDNGMSWQDFSDGLPTGPMRGLALGRGKHLFVITNLDAPAMHGVYKTVDIP